MKEDISDAQAQKLYAAILKLKNTDECHAFFDDLGTLAEIKALSQRFHVAELLSKGVNYGAIEHETGASTATISRVKKCLFHGAGGYKTVLERLKEDAK